MNLSIKKKESIFAELIIAAAEEDANNREKDEEGLKRGLCVKKFLFAFVYSVCC